MLPNTRHIMVDDHGWALHHRALHTISWDNEVDDRLTVMFSMEPPDLCAVPDGAPANDAALRAFYQRQTRENHGAVLEIESVRVAGVPSLRTLFRFPHRPVPGVVYLGSLVVPFQEWSYILRIQTADRNPWSQRYVRVLEQRLANPTTVVDPATASPVDWYCPPYGADAVPPCRDQSELPEHDAGHPNDALTRARRTLDHLIVSTRFDDRVLEQPRFTLNLA